MITVIIGHGRSPEGQGWGPRIDSADCVVRMWDWDWQDPRDYGTRYDFGLFELHPSLMPRFRAHNKRTPSIGWLASFLRWTIGGYRPVTMKSLPSRTEVISQARWCALGASLGGVGATGGLRLTRGTIAACWALERLQSSSELVLVGFDNVLAGKTMPIDAAFSPRYQQALGRMAFANYRPNVSKTGNHDLVVERKILDHIAERSGVVLRFAQEVWNDDLEAATA